MQKTEGTRERVPQTPIKSEPVSPVISPRREREPSLIEMRRESSPEPFIVTVSRDIESLYAAEEEGPLRPENTHQRGRDRETVMRRSDADDQRSNPVVTPGEAWIRNRNGQRRLGLGTAEVLERWRAASDESRERRASGQRRTHEPQQRREPEAQNFGNRRLGEQCRSVTQPHEAGFGRRPDPPTSTRSGGRVSNRDRGPPGGDSSGSSSESRQGGGGPNRRSRRGSSHLGEGSRRRSPAPRRHRNGGNDERSSGRSSRRQRRRSPSDSPSSSSSDDWDSDFTVLDDEGRRWQERRHRRRNPKAEYEKEQLSRIRERIQKMVGQDIQYAPTYKGVKDIVSIIKYAGQNDNGIFTRWLDHLLMYFQLNRMCGPDNELVRLSAMYNSLDGVAEEWYCDIILHAPKRSWMFKKAVCSLFLTYVFGSAASHAAREFNEVKYSRTEGVREYAQRLKTKARHLARKPDESTMIVRFLAGLPREISQRLTLRERLDPARHRLKHFVNKLHELEEAENMTKTVNAAILDDQQRSGLQGARRPGKFQPNNRDSFREPQRSLPQRNHRQPMEKRPEERPAKGKGPSADVICFRCQGRGHYSNNPICPMFEKNNGPNRQLRDRPQLKAARVPEEDDGPAIANESQEETNDTREWDDGSQWDSATEGEGSLHSHENAPRLNRISMTDILSEPDDDDIAYVRAARGKVVSAQKENPSRAAMHTKIDRPRRSKAYESCLSTYVEINGMEALTLFDSGSSTDMISPDFAQVSDTRIYALDKAIPLQLGTVGSRASINYGTRTSVELADKKEEKYYFDVVNIDRYDAILGAPFMRKFRVRLDFNDNSIIVGEVAVEALLPEEEAAVLKGRTFHRKNGERSQED